MNNGEQGQVTPALGSAELKHGQSAFDIQQAGHIPPALGSEDDLHEHLSFGIPTSQDESLGHLQPEGQFDLEYMHELFATVQFEPAVHFLFDQHSVGIQIDEFESHTQSEVGISGPVQYAGHTPLPALGSSVLKHRQSESLVIFVSHAQSDVVQPFTQQAGHVSPALGSDQDLSFWHSLNEQPAKSESHIQSGVKDHFMQYAGHYPLPARGFAVDLHSHLDLGTLTNNAGSVGHLQPDGQLVPVHSHEFVGTVKFDDVVHFFSD
ncbi:MAG: hypothetical protein EZS28_037954 [Streblomastix strix]|uniref:Uncharacterized protein n=1 Tax=Streblomastix strix TaxID=222440 RepID=A0A5J4U857_9EUKA|nr:MAG: hypothetical protein EZS28_037954 [Streblomastix strix]